MENLTTTQEIAGSELHVIGEEKRPLETHNWTIVCLNELCASSASEQKRRSHDPWGFVICET